MAPHPERPRDTDTAAADLLALVRAGEADLPADAVRPLVRAYLDLLAALEAAPRPVEVDGFLDVRSIYSGWYREIRGARMERSRPVHALDPATAGDADGDEVVERRREEDRQAARALVAAFAQPRAESRERPRSSVRGGGRRG